MAKLLSYSLSGCGIVPKKSFLIVGLLKGAGVKFNPRSKFGALKGTFHFSSTVEIEKETRGEIIKALAAKGIKQACLTRRGSYVKQ